MRIERGTGGTADWWAAEWEGDWPGYSGEPSPEIIRWIAAHTKKDSRDRQYFVVNGSWRRLRSADDFKVLNGMLEEFRKQVAGIGKHGPLVALPLLFLEGR